MLYCPAPPTESPHEATSGAASEVRPGHGLLIASPSGPGRRRGGVDTGAALPALAAVAPGGLLGTGAAGGSVAQLAAPGEVAQVIAALRTAAAARGVLAGVVLRNGRQGLPHLALGLPGAGRAAHRRT